MHVHGQYQCFFKTPKKSVFWKTLYNYHIPSPINTNFAWIKHYSLRKHISEIHPNPCPYTRVITILKFSKMKKKFTFVPWISLVHHHRLTPFPFNPFSEGIMFKHWQIDWNPLRYTVAIYHFSKDRLSFVNFLKSFYQ